MTLTRKQFKRFKHHAWREEMGEARTDARVKIVQLANQHKMRDRVPMFVRVPVDDPKRNKFERQRTQMAVSWREPTLFGMGQLNQAVKIVRHHKLGNEALLRTAGFNV